MKSFLNTTFTLLFSIALVSMAPLAVNGQSTEISKITEYIDTLSGSSDAKKADLYNKLGFSQWEQGNYITAIEILKKSVVINSNLGNENALKNLYTSIGMIYSDLDDFESALLFFRKSLVIREKFNEARDIASELINIAISLQQLKRHYEAIIKAETALEMAKTINDMPLILRCYGVLAESHEKVGEAKTSMEYFSLYATLDRHIQQTNIEKTQKEAKRQVHRAIDMADHAKEEKEKTESELKKTEQNLEKTQRLSKLQQTKLKVQELEIRERDAIIQHKSLLIKVYIGAMSVVLLCAFLLYRNYRFKKISSEKLSVQNREILHQQEIIERKNRNITQSISYAQRIQEAMLPSADTIQDKLPDSFTLFKPRHVVSGDFYWIATNETQSSIDNQNEQITQNEEEIFIAAADCTGHGVPGAFMSMIGFNLLNEIIGRGIFNPQNILEALNRGVKNSLKQDQTQNCDGMDIALCRINKTQKTLEFSGALNPLYYCQNGNIYELEGGLFPIGGDELDLGCSDYPLEKIKIESPTTCYIFSDGFQDQFGGPKGLKFMSKKFKDLLFSIHTKPMSEQKQILNQTLEDWMGDLEQVDDILIIGFRI